MSEIDKAIILLTKNGYRIVKFDKRMEHDADECVEMSAKGQDKECFGCFCNICLTRKS